MAEVMEFLKSIPYLTEMPSKNIECKENRR